MTARRSSDPSPVIAEEPTPDPASAVSPVERGSEAHASVLLDYFASPPAEMAAMDAAWNEALVLYGDEDSDAWIAALESGTHPLCRVQLAARPI